jgi:hypothetical protein
MSFIYSRALVEAYSRANPSDTDACALLSGSPTPPLFLPSDKTTAFSRLSRFGMTFGHLTADRGEELLTWWLAGFPAKTSASQAKAPASMEPEAECGRTWRGSLARFDPASSSWRTAQPSLLGDSEECSVTWPRSGMTAGGLCWELPMWAPPINATVFGLLLPTPVCFDAKTEQMTGGATVYMDKHGKPRRKTPNGSASMGLARLVHYWPTAHNAKEGAHASEYERNTPTLAAQVGGALNPTWVEWLMGWPLGWTDLKPLGTGKSRNAPPQPGDCLPEACEVSA